MATTQEQLDAVNDAIYARTTGGAVRSYIINGRDIRYEPLDVLMKLRDRFQAELANENGPARNYVEFERPD